MYDELVKDLRGNHDKYFARDMQAADAIEELIKDRDNWKVTAKEEREMYWHWFDNYQRDVPSWIPVTERLPEVPNGEYFSKDVYVTDGTAIAKACIMRDYDGATSWTYTGIGEITHWCEQIPLPQLPKEKNS